MYAKRGETSWTEISTVVHVHNNNNPNKLRTFQSIRNNGLCFGGTDRNVKLRKINKLCTSKSATGARPWNVTFINQESGSGSAEILLKYYNKIIYFTALPLYIYIQYTSILVYFIYINIYPVNWETVHHLIQFRFLCKLDTTPSKWSAKFQKIFFVFLFGIIFRIFLVSPINLCVITLFHYILEVLHMPIGVLMWQLRVEEKVRHLTSSISSFHNFFLAKFFVLFLV